MNQPMHRSFSVLHVATAKTWRGGEQQVAYLVDELKKKHIRQYVLCSLGSAMENHCINNSIPYFSTKKRSSFDISFAARLSKICKSNKIELVHVHDSHAHTFAVLASILFNNVAKIIVSRRVDFEISRGPFSSLKYNHPRVSRILCVSESIKQITAKAVEDKTILVTVHSGIDVTRFTHKTNTGILHREYFLADNVRIVGNVAALAPHKDYFTFVDTVDILKNTLSDTVYFIIGDGPEKKRIEEYIKQKKLEKIIFMTGFRNDIADLMPEMNVMLLTSETEGLGTSILDAFACSVPVVATAAGGIPEIVIHEQTGLLGTVRDAPGLAMLVKRVMSDSELKQKLVKGALKHLQEFSKEQTAVKTLNEYTAVVGMAL